MYQIFVASNVKHHSGEAYHAVVELAYVGERQDNSSLAYIRQKVTFNAAELMKHYKWMVYGNSDLSIPQAFVKNPNVWNAFYKHGCLSIDGSTCWGPDSSYYADTAFGFQGALFAFIQRLDTLQILGISSLGLGTEQVKWVLDVDPTSVRGGAISLVRYFSRNVTVITVFIAVNAALFGMMFLFGGIYYLRTLAPMLNAAKAEPEMAADLMAKVPKDFDLEDFLNENFLGKKAKASRHEPSAAEALKQLKGASDLAGISIGAAASKTAVASRTQVLPEKPPLGGKGGK